MPGEILRAARFLEPDGTEVEEEEWQGGSGWALTPAPHHLGDARFQVLDGLARVRIGRTDRVYRAGESVIVTPDQSVSLEAVEGHGVRLLIQRWSPRTSADQPQLQRRINHHP